MSTVCQVYSSILHDGLSHHLESSDLLVDEQNGFRKHRACIDHIYTGTSLMRSRIKEGKATLACFIDFHKAFVWVNSDLLFFKLIQYGADGQYYKAFKAFYQAPVACVQGSDVITGWFPTPFGIKEGDVLSPTLFAIFVYDLAQEIKSSALGVALGDVVLSSFL